MLPKISKILKILGDICIGVTILICLIFSVFTIPRLFGISPFVVKSGSMEPEISTGSVVFTNTHDTDIKIGDVVTYRLSAGENKGVFVTHRVSNINQKQNLIQTKGDHNDYADGWLEESDVLGTVMFHVPAIGFLLDRLQKKGFVILAIWVFVINALLIMIPYLLDMQNNKDTAEESPSKIRVTSRNGNASQTEDILLYNKVKVTSRNAG